MKKRNDPTDFMSFLDTDSFDYSNADAFSDRTGLDEISTFTTEQNDLFGFNNDNLSESFPKPNQGIEKDKVSKKRERKFIEDRFNSIKTGGAPMAGEAKIDRGTNYYEGAYI